MMIVIIHTWRKIGGERKLYSVKNIGVKIEYLQRERDQKRAASNHISNVNNDLCGVSAVQT